MTLPNTKGITLDGGGNTTLSGQIVLNANIATSSRITRFTFPNAHSIYINGSKATAPFRIDHNTFTPGGDVILEVDHNAPGLIDHNTFTLNVQSEMIHIYGMGAGDSSGWTDDVIPGDWNMVFLEDNTFTYNATGNPAYFFGSSAVQSYYGSRTVFRHNTLNMVQIDQHGTAGSIGARWWEIYENTFNTGVSNASQCCYIELRGGSGVVFNNRHTGTNEVTGSIDLFEEDSGYPALYQVGRGKNQVLDPAYVWNNTDMTPQSGSSNVQVNRDYYLQPKPGYTPFIYPYPLDANGLPNPSTGSAPPSTIIDPDRRIDWSQAGIPGGIPTNRAKCATTACAALENAAAGYTNGTLEAQPLIQNALDSAPNETYVFLPAGTYKVTSPVWVRGYTTLRGAGPDRTILAAPDGNYAIIGTRSEAGGAWFYLFDPDSVGSQKNASVVSGADKGSTSLSLASNPGIQPGDVLLISQVDDGALVNPQTDQGWIWTCLTDTQGRSRCLGQLLEVTAVSGNTVSFSPPLNWTYSAALSPQIRVAPGSAYITRAGLEDLKIMETATIQDVTMVSMEGSRYSWVKNIEVQNATYRALSMTGGIHNEIRDSYFHEPNIANQMECGRNRAYGISLDLLSTANLVVNNIIKNLDGGMIFNFNGASANVMAYNYLTSPCFYDDDWLAGGPGMNHGSHPMMNLWEGNIGTIIASDILQGSSSHNTVFRAYSPGWTNTQNFTHTPTQNSVAVMIEARNRYVNVVGSVLGKSGWTDGYQDVKGVGSAAHHPIWLLGYAGGTGLNMDDAPTVLTTLFRAGNYDYYNKCAWDDVNNRCLTAGELTGLNLPASLYLASRPSWFNTNFGNVPWPPIGPEVTGGQDSAGHASKLPAQLCYENTAARNVPFNALACYGAYTPPAPSVPVIIQQPVDRTVQVGASATFSISATGVPAPTTQWRVRVPGSSSFVNIAGATTSSYIKANAQLSDSGTQYQCVVTNAQGSVTSTHATLTVASGNTGGTTTLADPDVSGIKERIYTTQDEVVIPAVVGASGFNWEVVPQGGSVGASELRSFGDNVLPSPALRRPGAPTLTTTPRFSLASQNLTPDRYTLRVQATNGNQTSNWVSASITLVEANLNAVKVFPNPWRADKHTGDITFSGLSTNTTVKIFTVSGHLIRKLPVTAGQQTWDLKTDSGDRAASGVYLYVIEDGGQKRKGKLAIIR